MLSSSVAVYVPVLPRSAAAPQILCIGYDVAFTCEVEAGDETVDVTVLTVGIPSKDLNQAAQRRLQHAQEVSDDLHNLDTDMRLAWLWRGIPVWITEKVAAGDETLDVTVMTVGIPSKDLNQAAQRRLQHTQEVPDDHHNLDMDLRLAWLSRGIPLWITDKGSSYEERDD